MARGAANPISVVGDFRAPGLSYRQMLMLQLDLERA